MDKRFAAVHTDPRFVRRNAKKETKVTDERFSALATDKISFGLSAKLTNMDESRFLMKNINKQRKMRS